MIRTKSYPNRHCSITTEFYYKNKLIKTMLFNNYNESIIYSDKYCMRFVK